ncbi:hypothetical protein D1007_25360 [Hordeum vulgare]|nr:hypothetical protein D1007_25360 [Hordeum vulgare]
MTDHVFTTELSFPLSGIEYDESYFSADSEGRLTLLHLQREGLQLRSWRWDDDGWLIDIDPRVVRLKHPYPQNEIQDVVYTCLGEKSGTLLVKDNHGHAYAADVKTGVMQEVTRIPHKCNISRKKVAPLDMDWPAFLVSRLGIAICSSGSKWTYRTPLILQIFYLLHSNLPHMRHAMYGL